MNGLRGGSLAMVVVAVLLVLFAGWFMLSAVGGAYGTLISVMSVVVFGGAVLGLVVCFGLYRRVRSAG